MWSWRSCSRCWSRLRFELFPSHCGKDTWGEMYPRMATLGSTHEWTAWGRGDITTQTSVPETIQHYPAPPCPTYLQREQPPVLLAPNALLHHIPHCQRIGRSTETAQVVLEGAGRGGGREMKGGEGERGRRGGGGGEGGGERFTDGVEWYDSCFSKVCLDAHGILSRHPPDVVWTCSDVVLLHKEWDEGVVLKEEV